MRARRAILWLVAVLAGTPAIEAIAQATPNFSGTWTPVPGRTKPEARDGPSIKIRQDGASIAITNGTEATRSYRLDGSKTTRQEKDNGVDRTVTATVKWTGSVLTITEEVGITKREYTYAFEEGGTGLLVATSATTLLHTRGGALTVSTIGPVTRVYRKG
jgi:hypothetical protein